MSGKEVTAEQRADDLWAGRVVTRHTVAKAILAAEAAAREEEAEEIAARLEDEKNIWECGIRTGEARRMLAHMIRQRHAPKPPSAYIVPPITMSDAHLMTKLSDVDEARVREIVREEMNRRLQFFNMPSDQYIREVVNAMAKDKQPS